MGEAHFLDVGHQLIGQFGIGDVVSPVAGRDAFQVLGDQTLPLRLPGGGGQDESQGGRREPRASSRPYAADLHHSLPPNVSLRPSTACRSKAFLYVRLRVRVLPDFITTFTSPLGSGRHSWR